MANIKLREREVEIKYSVDVCVVGAGPAGLGAALSAARMGAKVALVERNSYMGGNFTAASVGTICGLYYKPGSDWEYVTRGVVEEVVTALKSQAKAMGPLPFQESAILLYVPWAAKRLFDEMISSNDNITSLLHSLVSEAVVDNGRLEAVIVASKQGPVAISATSFVDCTGDGDLVFFAGGSWEMGDEQHRQHASMQFFLQNADQSLALGKGIPSLAELISTYGQDLTRDGGALIPTLRPGEFIGAMTRITNPDGSPIDITDLEQATWAEIEGRRVAEQAAQFVIDRVPGFANAFLSDTAGNIGIRESRRVLGEYVLTGKDVLGCARFDDPVACGAWPQEYHSEGKSTKYVHLSPGEFYQVPLRSLKPLGFDNLFVAGRCISADFDALASIRVMAPSMALGEAAGIGAAHLALEGDLKYQDIRESLVANGAFLG